MLLRDRLPGAYFQEDPPSPRLALPRMDIAAFAGFTSNGPVDTPVAVEDLRRFRDIFGADPVLGWDPETQQFREAYLGRAINAFFQNGGRRCWVVRLANHGARTNRFQVPFLIDAERFEPAAARARAPGTWSDPFRLGAYLTRSPISFQLNEQREVWELTTEEPLPESGIGDLFALDFADGEIEGFFPVDAFDEDGLGQSRFRAHQIHWFQKLSPTGMFRLSFAHGNETKEQAFELSLSEQGSVMLVPREPGDALPEPGVLARGLYEDSTMLLPVTGRVVLPEKGRAALCTRAYVSRPASWARARIGSGPVNGLGNSLQLNLAVWRPDHAQPVRMDNLGFHQQHRRRWTKLLDDQTLFGRSSDGRPRILIDPGIPDAVEPRFPVSGPEEPGPCYLPLGMGVVPDPALALGIMDAFESESPMMRDGLAGFDKNLFLDRELSRFTARTIAAEADRRLYVEGEALHGIHALWLVEEATLLAVPDAVHGGWENCIPDRGTDYLGPPILDEIEIRDGHPHLAWSYSTRASRYLIEESDAPDFQRVVAHYYREEPCLTIGMRGDCARTRYFRVRAESGDLISPWSNTRQTLLPLLQFLKSDREDRPTPIIGIIDSELGAELEWSAGIGAIRLQCAHIPDFSLAETLFQGDDHRFSLKTNQPAFYRVRREGRNEIGPWSNTVFYRPQPEATFCLNPVAGKDEILRSVHRAMLRFCAARRDVIALLALPRHFRENEASSHLAAIRPATAERVVSENDEVPLTFDENAALTYGALYHPWPLAAKETGAIAAIPPDGMVAGLLAARALRDGAWVAPANIPFQGLLALDQAYGDDRLLHFFQQRINLIRLEPEGFITLSADTLSDDPELSNINVRRLLILMRRLMLAEGKVDVFQTNNEAFRRSVMRRFEALLSRLYLLGAFQGALPRQAFRVSADPVINDRTAQDLGRFFLDIRIAPSLPLHFLTIRMILVEGQGAVIEEVRP